MNETFNRAPLLECEGLAKTFVGTTVLKGVDLTVARGEVHALVGANGSGKSTLIKLLSGYHAPDRGGRVRVEGVEIGLGDPHHSMNAGLRFVHQDLALVNELTVVENLGLGRGYQRRAGGGINWRHERREASRRLTLLGYDIDVDAPVGTLTASERTGVAIARALYDEETVKILVVDEPTAVLPRDETLSLFRAIRRVTETGVGVVYVSHRLDEIFAIGDRVTVLRDGTKVGTYDVTGLDESRLVELMLGDTPARTKSPESTIRRGNPVLEVEGLRGVVCDGIDLSVSAGEIVGIAGLTGSGREEILPMLFGVTHRSGRVRVGGTDVPPEQPHASVRSGLALIPADRHAQGALLPLSVLANSTITDLTRFLGPTGRINRAAERREVAGWIEALNLRPRSSATVMATLSGGNQQKVVLSKWLRLRPTVLLLDEPTQGVDVHAKASIHDRARAAAKDGAAVVVASTDDSELLDLCDRIVVLADGQIAAELPGHCSPEALFRAQMGTAAK